MLEPCCVWFVVVVSCHSLWATLGGDLYCERQEGTNRSGANYSCSGAALVEEVVQLPDHFMVEKLNKMRMKVCATQT